MAVASQTNPTARTLRPARKKVLIGFAESLAAPETAWSLADGGFDVVAFSRRGAHPSVRWSPHVRVVEITPPENDADGALDDLARTSAAESADLVMPLDDASVWLIARVASAIDAAVVGPVGEAAEFALDKRSQLIAATTAGFRTPPTEFHETRDSLVGIEEFPVVLKPAMAIRYRENVLTRGQIRICADRGELTAALNVIDQPFLSQPLLAGIGHGLFGLAQTDGLHALSAHERVRMMNPQGSGSSACRSAEVDDALIRPAERLLSYVGWRGMFMIELLHDKSGTWFMEINGRPWGSMALARRLGLEYPAWAAQRVLGEDFVIPEVEISRRESQTLLCRHLGRELIHLLFVLRGPRSKALRDWPSRGGTIRDLLSFNKTQSWYNHRRGETRLFLYDTWRTIVEELAT